MRQRQPDAAEVAAPASSRDSEQEKEINRIAALSDADLRAAVEKHGFDFAKRLNPVNCGVLHADHVKSIRKRLFDVWLDARKPKVPAASEMISASTAKSEVATTGMITHAHKHAHTHTRAYVRTRACTHTCTHTQVGRLDAAVATSTAQPLLLRAWLLNVGVSVQCVERVLDTLNKEDCYKVEDLKVPAEATHGTPKSSSPKKSRGKPSQIQDKWRKAVQYYEAGADPDTAMRNAGIQPERNRSKYLKKIGDRELHLKNRVLQPSAAKAVYEWVECDSCKKWRVVSSKHFGDFSCSMAGSDVTCDTPEDKEEAAGRLLEKRASSANKRPQRKPGGAKVSDTAARAAMPDTTEAKTDDGQTSCSSGSETPGAGISLLIEAVHDCAVDLSDREDSNATASRPREKARRPAATSSKTSTTGRSASASQERSAALLQAATMYKKTRDAKKSMSSAGLGHHDDMSREMRRIAQVLPTKQSHEHASKASGLADEDKEVLHQHLKGLPSIR